MMNTNMNAQTKVTVAEKLRKRMSDNMIQSALTAREDNTYNAIKHLKENRNTEVQLSNPASIIRALARLGYVAGSMVGIITNLIEVSGVLMDKQYNTQFLKADGSVDIVKLRKIFPEAGSNGQTTGYTQLFSEELGNILVVENLQGRRMRLVKAVKSDIARFVEEINTTAHYTQDDLVKIGQDLEKIGRVMQELEIDSAKDATVKEGMMEITQFMSAYTCKLASKKMTISNNFNEIVNDMKLAKEKRKDIEFNYGVDDYLSLNDAYTYAQEQYNNFIIANPEASKNELLSAKIKAVKEAMKDSLIEDAATELKRHMVNQQNEKYFKPLVEMYKASDMKLFEEFLTLDMPHINVSIIDQIKHMVIVCIEMINNHYRYFKHMSMTDIEELAIKLRDAIYSCGESKGVCPEDTFLIACHAAWFKRNKNNKIVPTEKYSYSAIAALFTTELKWHINADAMYSAIEVELPDGLAVDIGTPFPMVNGECEVELPNGDTDYIFCTEEDDYTGTIIAKVINNEPVFVKYENEYAYNTIEFLMFDNVCDAADSDSVYNANTITDDKIAGTMKHIKETLTINMDEAAKDLALKSDVNKLSFSFKQWAGAIQLSVAMKDNYALNTCIINNKIHVNVQRADGAARMLGSLCSFVRDKEKKMSDYNAMDTIVCAKGAIVILK